MWLRDELVGLSLSGVLALAFIVLLTLDLLLRNRNPRNYPPGPPGLPLVGNVFNVDPRRPHIYLTKLAGVYGNVFSLRLGRDRTVFVSGYRAVREAIVTQADVFAERPYSPMAARLYTQNTGGFFFSNGPAWKRQRRFAIATLRNLGLGGRSLGPGGRSPGLGGRSLEDSISQESRHLQLEIEAMRGEAFSPAHLLNKAVANIICQMVFGRRFEYDDGHFHTMLENLIELAHLEGSVWAHLYDAFPALMRRLPGPHNRIFSNFRSLETLIRGELERHKRDVDAGGANAPRDYMDAFLMEMTKHAGSPELGFDEDNLVQCCLDLFLAGSETTSKTLQWGLIYLINNPHVQERVQAEIDRVVGPDRQPSAADRAALPYTDAVLHEVQRMGNIVPLNGLRRAVKDTTLGGFHIPKGTTLMPILTSVLFDPVEWETPDRFNPDHFLDAEGRLVRREAFLPFSAGRRACLGESLARTQLFLFFVNLMQKLSFSTLDGGTLSEEGVVGATRSPHPFQIYAMLR